MQCNVIKYKICKLSTIVGHKETFIVACETIMQCLNMLILNYIMLIHELTVNQYF